MFQSVFEHNKIHVKSTSNHMSRSASALQFKSAFKYITLVKPHNNPVSLGYPNTFLSISYPNKIFPGKS